MTKRKQGRPTREGGYTKSVNLRLTEEQFKRLEAEARKRRLETGDVVLGVDILREFVSSLDEPDDPGLMAA